MNHKEKSEARAAGTEAFKNGKPCTPALDKNCMGIIKNSADGQAISILNAWLAGWTEANLAAEITPDNNPDVWGILAAPSNCDCEITHIETCELFSY